MDKPCPRCSELEKAILNLLELNPTFRSRPIGAPYSYARTQQLTAIAAEDEARKLLEESK